MTKVRGLMFDRYGLRPWVALVFWPLFCGCVGYALDHWFG